MRIGLNLSRFFYHSSRLCGLHMFKTFGQPLMTACILAVIATPNIATADIVYPSGYLASVGNPGVYVQRWGTAGGSTLGVVSCGAATCQVGLAYQWLSYTHPGYYWNFTSKMMITVPTGTLWNEAIRRWVDMFGRSGSYSSSWTISAGPLISTCMRASRAGDYSQGHIPLPATCDAILPAPAKCDFSSQAITLNHRTVDKNSVNGNTATTNFTVNCSTAVTVSVDNVQGNAPTPVLPGITSTIQIDGRPLGTRMQWQSGISTHIASSRLIDTGEAVGEFNASIVLRITVF